MKTPCVKLSIISIHALLAESDKSTRQVKQTYRISIHALLAESDSVSGVINNVIDNFYPRSPCGERHIINCNSNFKQKFLSTLSLRRATVYGILPVSIAMISIHALLAESDVMDTLILANTVLFLSTLSLRRAT